MIDDQHILKQLKKMPSPLKAEVLHYMDYLMSRYQQNETVKKPKFGSQKGFYQTTDDFDEPLEDFQEYM